MIIHQNIFRDIDWKYHIFVQDRRWHLYRKFLQQKNGIHLKESRDLLVHKGCLKSDWTLEKKMDYLIGC